MYIQDSYFKTQHILNNALKAESLRFQAISDNIANVDTPYFKRSGVVFESELKRALGGKNPYPFKAKQTHARHYSFYTKKDVSAVQPKITTEYDSVFRNDKNNVDVEKEMVDAAKSALRYQAFTSFLSRNHRLVQMIAR